MKSTIFLTTLAIATATSSQAAIILGDVIGIDFSSADGNATNYNVISSNISTPNVVRLTDNGSDLAGSTITGVTYTFSGANGFNADGGAQSWGGLAADPYYTAEAEDIMYTSNGATANLTIGGLDSSLTYNVRVYALINGSSSTESISINGSQVFSGNRVNRWNASTLEDAGLVFNNQTVNSSDQLVIEFVSGSVNTFANAVVIEAVPEPSSTALLGLGGLALLLRRRR